jgi:hypothetical protein
MTDDRSLERAARSWLEDGPTAAPDHTVDGALARIETTRQERAFVVPWRMPTMNPAMKIAGAAVLVVAAIAGSIYLLGGDDGGFGAASTPTPTPATSPSASADESATPNPAPSPFDPFDPAAYDTWEAFSSEIYDVRIGYPAGWSVIPATRAWDFDTDVQSVAGAGVESFLSPAEDIRVSVWKVQVEEGTTLRDWVAAYCELNTTPCEDLDGRLEEARRGVLDQHLAGALIEFTDDVQAFMPTWAYDTDMDTIWTQPAPAGGGEIIIVASWRPPAQFNSRELVEGFSFQLCVEDCEAP